MRVETFVLDYLRKTKNKKLTTEIIKESFVDTLHVGDSVLYQGEESVIIGFDVFGAWLVNEIELRTRDIQDVNINFFTYPLLLCKYYDCNYLYYSTYEITEIDLLKYKMKYNFLSKLNFEPCLEDTYYFKPYLNKSVFQIFCKYCLDKIVSGVIGLSVCIVFMLCIIYCIKSSGMTL